LNAAVGRFKIDFFATKKRIFHWKKGVGMKKREEEQDLFASFFFAGRRAAAAAVSCCIGRRKITAYY
jgi:hypothetical protein